MMTPAGISTIPMTQATLKLLMVSCRSYSAKAAWISRLLGVSLAMLGFPHLKKHIHFRGILEDARALSLRSLWQQGCALLHAAIDQVPVQYKLQHVTKRLAGFHVRGHHQPVRRQPIVKNIHQLHARPVGKIIEQAGAINKIVSLVPRL